MKCFKCGTEFNFPPCPTCERNRKLEEQNRLSEEQNRKLAEQNRLIEEENRANARFREEQERRERERNRREEQYYEEQRNLARAEELDEQFSRRLDELGEYAEERNLTPYYFYNHGHFSSIILGFLEAETTRELWEITQKCYSSDNSPPIANIITNEIREKIAEKCLKEFNKLMSYLESNERILYARQYDKSLLPEFKLGDIRQAASTHSADYIIMLAETPKFYAVFPTDLLSDCDSESGYDGKKIVIADFDYFLFLKNNKEAEKLVQIISNTTKRLNSTKEAVNKIVFDTISEYSRTNPVPVYNNDNLLENNVAQLREKMNKLYSSYPGDRSIISRIISVLPALFAFPLVRMLYEGFFGLSNGIAATTVTVVIAALLSAVSRIIFGVVTGILALVGAFWVCVEVIGIDGVFIILFISIAAGAIIGSLLAWILEKIDDGIYNIKRNKIDKLIDEVKKQIVKEEKSIAEEKQINDVSSEKARKKWEQGLTNLLMNKLDIFYDNLKDVKQIQD
jgi:hypothetical protein